MIANKTLKLSLKSLREFAKKRLTDEVLIDLDARDECPLEIVRHMCSPDKLGIQLLFIPEEFGGMGGGTFDVYCVCEEMARIDLGVATAVLAAGLLKAMLALHHKVLPPSVHCEHPNPDIDFAHSPLYVNTELKPWDVPGDTVRRAGLSAFGFGGTTS